MPTYEYRCASCGHEFERVQRMSEDPINECPQCHQATAKRMISQGNFILKGSGWYADLYSGSSNKKAGSLDSSSSSEAKGASSGGEGKAASSSGESKSSGGESKSSGGESKSSATTTASASTGSG